MNKFLYTLLLSSVIFTQSAVAMQEEEPPHNALAKRNKSVEKMVDTQLTVRGIRQTVMQYAGDFFKGVNLGWNAPPLGGDLICMTFSVGVLKDILEIDDEPGDLLLPSSSDPTATYFSRTTSFFYRGQEFQIKAYLPHAFISRQNYRDDEVIRSHPSAGYGSPQVDFDNKQVKPFYLPRRDIFLRPADRYKSWVGCPGAGLTDGGTLLDRDKYYLDGSIDTSNSTLVVSEK